MGPRYDDKKLFNSQELIDLREAGKPTWPTTPVGSHPANATPEGVHDMLGYIIGEWCGNKYVERPSPDQLVDPDVDLDDLASDRVVRGYYHRTVSGPLYVVVHTHAGRSWTRFHDHPIDAAKHAARYGFRLAQDIRVE
jgi:hypothetical protein